MNKPGYIRIFDRPEYQLYFDRLYRDGYTDKEMAAILNTCETTVADYRRSLGLKGNGGTGYGGWRVNSTTRAKWKKGGIT